MATIPPGAERLRHATAERNAGRAANGQEPLWPDQVYLDAVWDSALTSTQKITALCYGNHARSEPCRDRAWVIRDRLMQQTGIRSRDTIAKVNAELVRTGWLEPGGHRPGHKQITVYLLALPVGTSPDSVTGPETMTGPDSVTGPEITTGPDFAQNQSQFLAEPVTESAETGHKTGTRLSTDSPQDSLRDSHVGRGSRVPKDFTVDDSMRAWAKKKTPLAIVDLETAQFIDHWTAKPGKDGLKLDWVAAWRTWMRNRQQWNAKDAARSTGNSPATNSAPRSGYRPYQNPTDTDAYRTGGL